jgi:hypothetical protein
MDSTEGFDQEGADQFEKDLKESFAQDLPEAPASATIRVYIDDFSTLVTMRGREVRDIVKQVEYIIDFAKKKGWKSTWNKDIPNPQSTASTPSQSHPAPTAVPNGLPVCSIHNRPMKLFDGKWGKFYKCTAKLGEGEWCTEKVNIK